MKRLLKRSRIAHAAYKYVRDPSASASLPFTRTQDFRRILRVLPNTMVPVAGLLHALDCVVQVNQDGVPGGIAECGVHAGGCAGLMGIANKSQGVSRQLYLFDSFRGMPAPTSRDKDVLDNFLLRHHPAELGDLEAIGSCVGPSRREVEDFLKRRLHLNACDYVVFEGWFQETLPAACDQIGHLAILRLDGDWYESTLVCLEALYGKLSKGGYLIVDDYGGFAGCRDAVHEFFAREGVSPEMRHVSGTCIHFCRKKDGIT